MAVRHESVRLSLIDAGFSTGMAKAAAAAGLLERRLDSIDGELVETRKNLPAVTGEVDNLGRSARRAGPDIGGLNRQSRLLLNTALALGPALVPVGAVAIPAMTGLATSIGFAAVGMGTLVAATQGVGDALEAVNEAALEPSVDNLLAAREAMEKLGPEAQNFVQRFQEIRPVLADIGDAAAAGWFPGLTEALGEFESLAPRFEGIFGAFGQVGGDLSAQAAGSTEFRELIDFIAREGPPTFEALGRAAGNVAAGLGRMLEAFTPLNRDFTDWLLDVSRGFSSWADGLAATEGFREFIDYIRRVAPEVQDFFTSFVDSFTSFVQAIAPVSDVVLGALTGILDTVAAIAASPVGTPLLALLTGFSALRVATAAAGAAMGGFTAHLAKVGPRAFAARAGIAALAVAGAAVASEFGLTNTAMGAMAGLLVSGGPWGAAIGAGVGGLLDFAAAAADTEKALAGVNEVIESGDEDALRERRTQIRKHLEEIRSFQDQAQRALKNLPGTLTGGLLGDTVGQQAAALSDDMARAENAIARINGALLQGRRENLPGLYAAGLSGLGDAAGETAREIGRLEFALQGLAGFLNKREALLNYRDALDELRKGLKDGFTREDRRNIIGVGDAILQVAESLKQPALRAAFIDNAISRLRTLRREARGPAKAAIQELIDQLKVYDGTDATAKPDVDDKRAKRKTKEVRQALEELERRFFSVLDANNDPARTAIDQVIGWLGGIPDETVNIWIRQHRVNVATSRPPGQTGPGLQRASGGPIVGPGGPRDDQVDIRASNGEFIVNAESTRRHRELIEAINADRFADGGMVGRLPVQPMTPMPPSVAVNVDLDRVARAMQQRGPVVIQLEDGRELRGFIRDEIGAADDMAARRRRAGG